MYMHICVIVCAFIQKCIYTYRRFRGASPACPTPLDREIDFDFDSFVRGEAKLCGCVRERYVLNAGAVGGKLSRPCALSRRVLEQ